MYDKPLSNFAIILNLRRYIMEHDVEWTGDLRELLQRYESRTESYLCSSSDVRKDGPKWKHFPKRSSSERWPPEDSYSCLAGKLTPVPTVQLPPLKWGQACVYGGTRLSPWPP